MRRRDFLMDGALLVGSPAPTRAVGIPSPAPDKLNRITAFFQNEVASGRLPGSVILIQQHGKSVYLSIGNQRLAARMCFESSAGNSLHSGAFFGSWSMSRSWVSPRRGRLRLPPETHAFTRILGCCEKFNAVLLFEHSLHCLENFSATRIHLCALVRLDHAHRLSSYAGLQS